MYAYHSEGAMQNIANYMTQITGIFKSNTSFALQLITAENDYCLTYCFWQGTLQGGPAKVRPTYIFGGERSELEGDDT